MAKATQSCVCSELQVATKPDCKGLVGHLIPPGALLSQGPAKGEGNRGVWGERKGASSALPEPRRRGTGGDKTPHPLLSLGCVSRGRARRR